jgi:hypothetical protein
MPISARHGFRPTRDLEGHEQPIAGSCRVIDDRVIDEFGKDNLHGRLRRDREAL